MLANQWLANQWLAEQRLTKIKGAPTSVPFFMKFAQWLFLACKSLIIVFACLVLSIGVITSAYAESLLQRSDKQLPECLFRLRAEPVNVARVTDGDTLVLSDQRRIRLIGINTLELNEKNPDDRFWANAATNALELFVDAGALSIIPGIETHDQYGRLLAHLTRHDGLDASHELVSQGLAFAVAVGKNTRCANELYALENDARRAASGLWRTPGNWQLSQTRLTGRDRGFRIVHGQVKKIKGRGKSRTFLLDNGLIVRLGQHWPHADTTAQKTLESIAGRYIRVKGWLSGPREKTLLTVGHPTNLEVTQR